MELPTFLACQPYLHLLRNGSSLAKSAAWPPCGVSEEEKESSQHCQQATGEQNRHRWTVLTGHVVSIEPAVAAERPGRNDGHDDDDDNDEDVDDEQEQSGTNPRSLGPAFFVPPQKEKIIGNDVGNDDVDSADRADADFDFGQFHMEFALYSSRGEVSAVNTTPSSARRQYSSTKNNDDDDADAILLAKIDDRYIYQIDLESLQCMERTVHEDDSGVPSCLVLHFPGCSFRIFATSSAASSSLLKDASSSAGTGTSSSTEVVDKEHRPSKALLDEKRDAIYAALHAVIHDSEDLHLPFPLEEESRMDVSVAQDVSKLDRSVECRRAHVAAFTDAFELETILGSTVSKDLTKSTASTLKERLNSLFTSIPSHAASSFCTKDELLDTLEQYNQVIGSKDEELEDTLEKFWNSNTSTSSTHGHHQSKRRRLVVENDSSVKNRSPTGLSSPSCSLQKQQDCMQEARDLLKGNKRLLSSKYELLALPQR